MVYNIYKLDSRFILKSTMILREAIEVGRLQRQDDQARKTARFRAPITGLEIPRSSRVHMKDSDEILC